MIVSALNSVQNLPMESGPEGWNRDINYVVDAYLTIIFKLWKLSPSTHNSQREVMRKKACQGSSGQSGQTVQYCSFELLCTTPIWHPVEHNFLNIFYYRRR